MSSTKAGWRVIAIVVGIGLLILLVKDFNSRMTELHRLSLVKENVSAEKAQLLATAETLEDQIVYAKSDAAIEEEARNNLHMAEPGDQVFVLVPDQSSSLPPTPTPAAAPQVVSNVHFWLALFVDIDEAAVATSP